MNTFYGPFRALEREFTAYLSRVQPGPGRAVMVLCPSGRLAAHLREQLLAKQEIVSNLHFFTFSQLLAVLDGQSALPRLPVLPGDGLHDYLLKNLLGTPGLNRYRVSRGFISALRASLRDLADGLADAQVLAEHLQTTTDPVLVADSAHLNWLVQVLKAYQEKLEQVPGYRSYQTYFNQALLQAEKSSWLAGFSEIILYGFYELTGRQLEVFNTLRAHYPLTVFWPYAAIPAFTYGRKFFETNILGALPQAQPLAEDWQALAASEAARYMFTAQSADNPPQGLQFISASNPERELFFVAKEMLRLHEEENISYKDMALTARTLDPYKTRLADVFSEHGVPLKTDVAFGWTNKPLCVFILNLLSLARGGFDREDILSVVNCPYFKHKNTWRYLIAQSLAKRDYGQWVDLVRENLPSYDSAFLPWLTGVKQVLDELEKGGNWEHLRTKALAFLSENTDIGGFSEEETQVWQELLNALDGFSRYSAVAAQAAEREFLDELFAALQAIEMHQVVDMPSGITAADIGALRGLGFKVVFILGMNEKCFPQVIREDPVLKDYYRRTLRDQLGFWLNQKMERFDEERLLFFCAAEAASEKLYLSFLRADEEGKPLVPSGYLVELARAARVDLQSVAVKHTGINAAQDASEHFLRLTAKELSLALAAARAPLSDYDTAGLMNETVQNAHYAAGKIASVGAPNAYDGMLKNAEQIFAVHNSQGFSPSALQELALCPMKYFLAKGVGLKEADELLSRSELAPNLRGNIYHTTLMEYYQQLLTEGLAGQLFDLALQVRLDRALATHYTLSSYKTFGIYPVIWEIILTDIHDKLSAFVCEEAKQLGDYVPSLFETYFEKIYAPAPEIKLKLKGIIDRIDIDNTHRTFRVIDYKSNQHGSKDLAVEMFKHIILQPFIYLLLATDSRYTQQLRAEGAALLNINQGYSRQELTSNGFEAVKDKAAQFFVLLIQLISQGQFFISPGEHCAHCAYRAICRRDCFQSLMRARKATLALPLEEAKQ